MYQLAIVTTDTRIRDVTEYIRARIGCDTAALCHP